MYTQVGHPNHTFIPVLQVEKLLAEVDALIAQQGHENLTRDALDSRTRLYERVASEVSRLKYFLANGDQLPILQQLQPRADSAVKRLSSLLSQALDTALREGHQSAVLHCLQAYTAVGDTQSAEQVTHLMVPPPQPKLPKGPMSSRTPVVSTCHCTSCIVDEIIAVS